jgi:CheY-like chemotaxis protein
VRVIVRDTGVGIAETFHDRIFEEYFRVEDPSALRPRGLGLGLSIVSRIEKTLPDHTLRFWSRPGRGSRFSFTIPRTNDSASDHAVGSGATGPPRPQPLAGKYVFVVEDERLILDGLVETIRAAGCMVEGVKCVEAARDLLSSRDRCPDVLVTDFRLQHGKTGMDVVSVMRDRFEWAAATPILFVTGELNWPAPSDGFTGRWDVFRKPIDPDVLVQRLGELVNHPHP